MNESISEGTDSCRLSYASLSGLDSILGNGEPLHGFEERSHLLLGGGRFKRVEAGRPVVRMGRWEMRRPEPSYFKATVIGVDEDWSWWGARGRSQSAWDGVGAWSTVLN